MVVQHNLQAINSNRMLGITQGTLSGSAEKLSSGYKINRAADNAAGLTISEKMRKQIRGLTQASTNAEDGVSAVQTAEGALTEVHDMLQRMNELAVQASNGTNSESDRQAIQDEISQLTTEIDRVSETTKFNEIYLLKGNAQGTYTDKKVNAHDAGIDGKLVDNGNTAVFTKVLENGDKVNIAGEEYTIANTTTIPKSTSSTEGYAKYDTSGISSTTLQAGDTITDDGKTYTMVSTVSVDGITGDLELTAATAATDKKSKFKIVDANGTEHEYTVGTFSGDNVVSKADAENLIKGALKDGGRVFITADKDGDEVNVEVVEKLGEGEIGYTEWSKKDSGKWVGKTVDDVVKGTTIKDTTAEKVDSVNLAGTETIFTKKEPVSAADVEELVSKLRDGNAFRIYANSDSGDTAVLTVTIAAETNAKNGEYTIEDALKLLKHVINNEDGAMYGIQFAADDQNKEALDLMKELKITNNAFDADGKVDWDGAANDYASMMTVVGTIGEETPVEDEDLPEGNVLTVEEAYEKIAKELEVASSIGTDEGKGATVESDGEGNFTITKGSVTVKDDLDFNLHVGADADMTNKIGVKIEAMSTAGLGVKDLKVTAVDENGKAINDGGIAATYAIDAIADAIAKVSSQRSALGAVQNRLEHTIANLDNVVENTTAAESRIRDTDMATEMVQYSNANILAQAGQSMLAQANQSNQGVLSLLG